MTTAEAAAHLQSLLDAMYAGRSVRTPAEFQADLRALHMAIEVLNAAAEGKR